MFALGRIFKMFKTAGLLVVLATIAAASLWQPRDLADEAQEQLNQLQAIVQGDILTAHDELDALVTDFKTHEATVAQSGVIALQQEQQAVNAQLNTIKDLAHAAGADVSICTDVREQTLNRLPQRYADEINECIGDQDAQATQLASDARYIVDININKVHDLQYRLNQCNGNLLCISPLVTEIELNKIRLPQAISTEVQATTSYLTLLKLSVQSCADQRVSQYNTEAYSILNDITVCVDRILG